MPMGPLAVLLLVVLCLPDLSTVGAFKECREARVIVAHSSQRCNNEGCKVTCDRGFMTDGGRKSRIYTCDHETGKLTYNGADWTANPTKCIPVCGRIGCQNGGTCVAPGTCSCAVGYSGNNCQSRICPEVLTVNGSKSFTASGLIIKCHEGFALKSGETTLEAECQDGRLAVPLGDVENGTVICYPSCGREGCQNGGECGEPHGKAIRATVTYNESHLRVECEPGYMFLYGGGTEMEALCRDGSWDVEMFTNSQGDFECIPEKQRCSYPGKTFAFAYMAGDTHIQTLRCYPDHQMKDGREMVVIYCLGGRWKVPEVGWLDDLNLNCYRKMQEDAMHREAE